MKINAIEHDGYSSWARTEGTIGVFTMSKN